MDFSSIEFKDKSKEVIDLVKKTIAPHEVRLFADEVLKHKFFSMSKVKKIKLDKLKSLVDNMKIFSKLNLFRKTVLYFIARNMYEFEIVQYHNYFDVLDPHFNGELKLKPFSDVLKQNLDIEAEEAEEIFKGMDIFETNKITYS